MGAGSDNEPLASPGNFFLGRKRRVAKLFTKLLGRSFLPFPQLPMQRRVSAAPFLHRHLPKMLQ
jgi:hypothetical protein